jgi:micrococcal nuclease
MKSIGLLLTFLFCVVPQLVYAASCEGPGHCDVCTTCGYCGYCNSGGTCSVCTSGSQSSNYDSDYDSSSDDSDSSYRYTPRRSPSYMPEYSPPPEPPRPQLSPSETNREYYRSRQPAVRVITQPTPLPSKSLPHKTVVNTRDTTKPTKQFTGKCVGVSDGDTISVMYQGRAVNVRLNGIDCPEKAQPFGTQAKKFTSERAFGKQVTIYPTGTDRYGRTLGWVFVGDDCINRSLVTSGMAWWYRQYSPNEKKLAALEAEAKKAGRGLWKDCCAVAPWEWRRGARKSHVAKPVTVKTEAEPIQQESAIPVQAAGIGLGAGAILLAALGLIALRRRRL